MNTSSACDSSGCTRANSKAAHTEFSPAAIGSVLWVGIVLCALLDLHRIIDDQVHELVEAANLSLDTHTQLLIKPDLHRGVLLQEFEDEIDWRQKDLVAASSLTVRHFVVLWCFLMWKREFLGFGVGVVSRARLRAVRLSVLVRLVARDMCLSFAGRSSRGCRQA